MALDKLGIYNEALRILGERSLASITENREPRFLLDGAYDFGAVEHCLELVKPVFARKTITLNSPATSANHDLDSVHTLPADWIALVELYSDSKLDQPITRFINENGTIACEYPVVYARYISSDNKEVYANWSNAFAKVVAHYLAKELALRLSPEDVFTHTDLYNKAIEQALVVETQREPSTRPDASSTTMTETWRTIYNDALLILGQPKIVALDDDSHRRSVLDTIVNSGIVEALIEDIGWNWAVKYAKIEYNPSVEPLWGHQYVCDKPVDMHRFDGIWYDEYLRHPIKDYTDDGSYFYVDATEVYIKYVSADAITSTASWTPAFKKAIAGRLAQEAAAELAPEYIQKADVEYEKRYSRAKSVDAMQAPPRTISDGNWNRSRNFGRTNRRRP